MLFQCCHFLSIFAKLLAGSVDEMLQVGLSEALLFPFVSLSYQNGNLSGKWENNSYRILSNMADRSWETNACAMLIFPFTLYKPESQREHFRFTNTCNIWIFHAFSLWVLLLFINSHFSDANWLLLLNVWIPKLHDKGQIKAYRRAYKILRNSGHGTVAVSKESPHVCLFEAIFM